MAQYKICKKCCLEKEVNFFSTRKISKDGYLTKCKECISEEKKNYFLKNKEHLNKKAKTWRDNNKKILSILTKDFHLKNPDYKNNYYFNNKIEINKRYNNRRNTDVIFRLKENTRNLIKNSLKYNGFKKSSKTITILGCDSKTLKQHLESKFELWMNWENYGNPKDGIYELNKTWDIDHIIPLSSAINEEELIKLNHYTNLQPLCSYNNRFIKKNKQNG